MQRANRNTGEKSHRKIPPAPKYAQDNLRREVRATLDSCEVGKGSVPLYQACYDCGIILLTLGVQTFREEIVVNFKPYQHIVTLALKHIASHPDKAHLVLPRLLSLQEQVSSAIECERIRDVITALWYGHTDDSTDMELELFRYLGLKHGGDRTSMGKDAVRLIEGFDAMAVYDMDVRIFSKILRNQVDQGFWKVRTKLRETIRDLEKDGKSAQDIINYMYRSQDAELLKLRLDSSDVPLIHVLLEFHLERHEILIAPIIKEYRTADAEFRTNVNLSSFVRTNLLQPTKKV